MADPVHHVVHLEKKSLKRALGAGELFAIGYGDVGSSIYYALGATALYALGATPISLLLAGLLFVCVGLSYAEMASTFPEPGGSATFTRYAFNDLLSFIAGWGLLLDYIVTIAISAFAVPPYFDYVLQFFGLPGLHKTIHLEVSCGLILLLFLVNLIGIRHSGFFSLLLAIVTIVSQILFVIGGVFFLLNLPYVLSHLQIGGTNTDWSPSWYGFMKGTAMAMVAYTGIEAITQLAAETKKPGTAIPRAIKWTMATLVILYFGISTIGLSVVTPEELGTKYLEDPIGGIVTNVPVVGAYLAPWFGFIASLILLIAANAGLIGCSRLIFSMGEYYQVPHFFYKTHPRFRTPHVSLAFFSILAIVIIQVSRGEMLFLADLYNFGAQIAFFFACLSLIVLRFKRPDLERPYKVPFNIPLGKKRSFPLISAFGVLGTFAVWVTVVVTKPEGRYFGLTWIALGLVMYFFYRKKKRLDPMAQLTIEKIKVAEYKPMHLNHILVAARMLGSTEALQTACELAKSFKAKLTAVHVIEIPESLPMHAPMQKREEIGEEVLKRAEAVAREYHLSIDLKMIRARSIEEALLNLARHGDYDMVVIGAGKEEMRKQSHFAKEAEKLLRAAPCRVIFCKS